MTPVAAQFTPQQRLIIGLIAVVQFVNILDFVMVMPLGPDFARALDIDPTNIGFIGGSYTVAAALAGLLGAGTLDRFERKRALLVALVGLSVGTALGAFAVGLKTLLMARMVAGFFGGPATSLAIAIIADSIQPEIRGRAMGVVMAAFSVAQVLGVPTGLFLAEHYSFRAPFFAVAAVCLLAVLVGALGLPTFRAHLDAPPPSRPVSFRTLIEQPTMRWSLAFSATSMFAGFMLVPNISPFAQYNLHVARSHINVLYLWGGAFSFFSLQIGGRLVDALGSLRVSVVATVGVVTATALLFFWPGAADIPVVVFVAFMTSMSLRNVVHQTLTSKVPSIHERARFQSLQSTVGHTASAIGAGLSSLVLTMGGDPPQVIGIAPIALASMALTLMMPLLVFSVESRVSRRELPVPQLR